MTNWIILRPVAIRVLVEFSHQGNVQMSDFSGTIDEVHAQLVPLKYILLQVVGVDPLHQREPGLAFHGPQAKLRSKFR